LEGNDFSARIVGGKRGAKRELIVGVYKEQEERNERR
jgi:hypothetical protein